MAKLHIENLHVSVAGKEILKGVDLDVTEGKTMALLGPNGHGKSTLLFALMGHPNYTVTEGKVLLDGVDLLSLSVDERSKLGLFLAMQYPAEIPGVNSADFLKAAMNSHREKPMSLFQFYSKMQTAYKEMGIPFEMSTRNLNEGFSGGEKKRNEIFQMAMLEPSLSILDETDSGLDIDALRIVADGVNRLKSPETSVIVITHYQRLLDYIKPDIVHVLYKGRIIKTAGPELALELEERGYDWVIKEFEDSQK